jgi:prepilin-type processing-associated H-X9-DG protein
MTVGPNVFAIYPEYLTDPMITFCPSDAGMAQSIEYAHYDPVRHPGKNPSDWCFDMIDTGSGRCASAVSASYGYLGWMLDNVDVNDTSIADLLPLFSALGGAVIITLSSDTMLSAQLHDSIVALIPVLATAMFTPDPVEANSATDKDLYLEGKTTGNGGSSYVCRLAEGAERKLILDVTNAGASSKGQSEIFVMFDQLSTDVYTFNHVPGGSNVLFMDGHVEFIKFPGPAPVNSAMAAVIGSLFPSGG